MLVRMYKIILQLAMLHVSNLSIFSRDEVPLMFQRMSVPYSYPKKEAQPHSETLFFCQQKKTEHVQYVDQFYKTRRRKPIAPSSPRTLWKECVSVACRRTCVNCTHVIKAKGSWCEQTPPCPTEIAVSKASRQGLSVSRLETYKLLASWSAKSRLRR